MNRLSTELPSRPATICKHNVKAAPKHAFRVGRRLGTLVLGCCWVLAGSASLTAQAPVAQSAFSQYLSTIVVGVGTLGATGRTGDGGPAKSALINTPTSIVYDAAGNLYICDSVVNSIREVSAATGIITTVAGNGTAGFSGDGGPATSAQLSAPNAVAVDAAGNLYIADSGNNRIREVSAATGFISTIVGNTATAITANGLSGTATSISTPNCVFVDALGNVIYCDSNHYVARVLVAVGANAGKVYTIAGAGGTTSTTSGDNGPALSATFGGPRYTSVDARGDYFISDKGHDEVRFIPALPFGTSATLPVGIEQPGTIYDLAGISGMTSAGYSGDGGPGYQAQLAANNQVVADAFGNTFIAEGANNFIRVVDRVTGNIYTLAYQVGAGTNKISSTTTLVGPQAIAFGPNGNFAIADTGNHVIRYGTFVTAFPNTLVSGTSSSTNILQQENIADTLSAPALTAGAPADFVIGAASTCAGGAVTALSSCSIPVSFTPTAPGLRTTQLVTQETATGLKSILPLTGTGFAGAVAITPGIISTYAGTVGTAGTSGNAFTSPAAAAFDSAGNLYVASADNTIREITPAGAVSIFAGTGTAGNSGDGGPATAATLNGPAGVAVDPSGNVLIADTGNSTIREVSAQNGVINTISYTNQNPTLITTATGSNTLLNAPRGVASDSLGNLYIADTGNNVVRKLIRGSGVFVTLAGTQGLKGSSGDGAAATAALLSAPSGVAVDVNGNVFIADTGNNLVREISATTGNISTIAGNLGASALDDGGPATAAALNAPSRVAVDAAGDIFIADTGNNRVRFVSAATGIITTVAGSGTASPFSGDGAAATAATLNAPTGLALDATDSIYIADTGNQRIARVSAANVALNLGGARQGSTSGVTVATVTNFGNLQLTLSKITFSAQFAQSFTTGNDCTPTTTLAAGASCLLGVVFTPTATGPVTGTVTITDNAYNNTASTQTLTLTGTGTSAPANITVSGGSGQTVTPYATFPLPLTAQVVDNTGAPISGVIVTFTAPATGVTGTFANGSTTVQEVTSANGIATASLTAGTTDGNFSVVASVTGLTPTATYTETIAGLPSPVVTLAFSPATNPVVYGGTITLTATLTPSTLGGKSVSGTVTFFDNGMSIGTGTVAGSTATLSLMPNALTHNYTASYSGDANFSAGSTARPSTLVVTPLGITASAVSVGLTYGSPSIPTITGTLSGVLPADQANVVPIFAGIAAVGSTAPIGPTSNVGVYPIGTTLAGSAAGNYTVTSTSGTVTIVQATSSSALTFAPKNIGPATIITFTDTITPQFGGVPTGTVTYTDVGPAGTVTLGTSKASTTTTLAVALGTDGTHVITATYADSTNFFGSSASITIVVADPTFTATPSGSTVSVVQGGVALMPFTYQAGGGFITQVLFTCSGVPVNATCSVNPQQVTPAGTLASTMGNALVSVQTAGPGTGFTSEVKHPARLGGEHRMLPIAAGALPGLALLLLGIGRGSKARRKLAANLLLLLVGAAVLLQISGCGSSNTSAPLVAQVTPVGTSTITLTGTTAAGAVVSSFTFNVNVTPAP